MHHNTTPETAPINNRDNNEPEANETAIFVILFLKVIILGAFIYPLIHYTILNGDQKYLQDQKNSSDLTASSSTSIDGNGDLLVDNLNRKERIQKSRPPSPPPEPTCPSSYLQIILQQLCHELFVKHQLCTPEDVNNLEKHKLPPPVKTITRSSARNITGEPRGTIVGCVLVLIGTIFQLNPGDRK